MLHLCTEDDGGYYMYRQVAYVVHEYVAIFDVHI